MSHSCAVTPRGPCSPLSRVQHLCGGAQLSSTWITRWDHPCSHTISPPFVEVHTIVPSIVIFKNFQFLKVSGVEKHFRAFYSKNVNKFWGSRRLCKRICMVFLNETLRQISLSTCNYSSKWRDKFTISPAFSDYFFLMKPHTLIQTYNYKLLTNVVISDTTYLSFCFWTIKEVKTDGDNAKIWKF